MSVPGSSAADSDATVERSLRTFYVPYAATEWAVVQAWLPMSEDDWDAMIAMLQVMKRGLVSAPTPEATPNV